jgi:hypothetical protein
MNICMRSSTGRLETGEANEETEGGGMGMPVGVGLGALSVTVGRAGCERRWWPCDGCGDVEFGFARRAGRK